LSRRYPKLPIVGVGAILICSGKILLERRRNEPGRGRWSIPGGKVELGEEVSHAAIREVREETGLVVEKPRLVDVVDGVELDKEGKVRYHFVIVDYFLQLTGGRLKPASDAAELRWVRLDDVEGYVLTRTFREFFFRNRARLKGFDSCKG